MVRATATIRAITATEATIGLFGGIDTTAGIMAAGAGTAGVMDGAGVMDTAAAGTLITDPLESLRDALGSAGSESVIAISGTCMSPRQENPESFPLSVPRTFRHRNLAEELCDVANLFSFEMHREADLSRYRFRSPPVAGFQRSPPDRQQSGLYLSAIDYCI